MFGLSPIYDFQMIFTVYDANNGAKQMTTYSTEIEKFAVLGGSKRTIRRNGENGIGDADIMAEFYQAKQFHNLIVTREIDQLSAVFRRIYDRKLSFDFSFTVRSIEPESRFRHLQLVSKNARITKPPSSFDGDTLNIKYTAPQVFYFRASGENEPVKEKL